MASPSRWAITETVEQGEIAPVHIGERDMVVTRARNIKNEVWVRHVHYLPGDPPDYHEVKWIKVAPSKNKDTDKNHQTSWQQSVIILKTACDAVGGCSV